MSAPLVSFLLLAYNQENYIREAVEGAFAQTYSPLEIILSDDCSSDRTFEIMREMSQNYQGPHRIVLNRNDRNLGIGGHFNKLHEISKGEFVVAAAGDDISLADRVQHLANKWLESPQKIFLVYSGFERIANDGSSLTFMTNPKAMDLIEFFIKSDGVICGAVCAWHRDCFDRFGPLLDDVHHEDIIIPFRAAILGEIAFVQCVLVKYRMFAGITERNRPSPIRISRISRMRNDLESNINGINRDIAKQSITIKQKIADLLKVGCDAKIIKILNSRAISLENEIAMIQDRPLYQKIMLAANLRTGRKRVTKLLLKHLICKALNINVSGIYQNR